MLQLHTVLPNHGPGVRVGSSNFDLSRRSSTEQIKIALEKRLSLSNYSTDKSRRLSIDLLETRYVSSSLRKAFYSPSVSIDNGTKIFWTSLFKLNLQTKLKLNLEKQNLEESLNTKSVEKWSSYLMKLWKKNGKESFMAFECILQLFEICLDPSQTTISFFETFVKTLNVEIVSFLKEALTPLIDSDNLHNTDYVDMLLMYLSMYDVKTGESILADFISSIPYFGGFYLRQHGKRFQELFCYVYTNEVREYNSKTKCTRLEITPHYLSCLHFPPKKVIVSNAPPVKLKRRRLFSKDKFECEVSAGGLVSGMKPCLDREDIWVSYLDSNILGLDKVPDHIVPRIIKESVYVRPKFRRSTSMLRCSISDESDSSQKDHMKEFLYEKTENDFLSLQTKLDRFAEQNFEVNPLIILKEEHKAFYSGISNGLFWPAFHNLPEYIIDEYLGEQGKKRLAEDWVHYVKVNYHFAIHAARSCRQQDFLWIHDYHLFLVGLILRSLDSSLDSGFFLHIPFGLTETFVKDYPEQGLAVLRGLLGFTRVGFQTNKDTLNFINLVRIYFPTAELRCTTNDGQKSLAFSILHNSAITDVGTFPISIKSHSFLEMASNPDLDRIAEECRQKVMQGRRGKLFLSMERFDYTKGIIERLKAIQRYFEKYPERMTLDVFYQVAASSRTDISSYQQYQENVINLANEINVKVAGVVNDPNLKVVIIDQTNHPQEEVVWLYRAADILVATPIADGMNLVIKEAILCNPEAVFLLSSGAGAENELFDCGFGDSYIRVDDVYDTETFADLIHKSANLPSYQVEEFGRKLFDYTKQHDIDHWISSFMDHNWTQKVIRQRPIINADDRKIIFNELRSMRKRSVVNLLEDIHVGIPFQMAMNNVMKCLKEDFIFLSSDELDSKEQIYTNEILSLKEDLTFLDFEINRRPLHTLITSFQDLSTNENERNMFINEYKSLKKIFQSFGMADLIIFRWENVLVNAGSFDYSTIQSTVGGLLLSRFIDRFSTQAIIWSEQTYDNFKQQLTAPIDVAIIATLNGAEVHFNEQLMLENKCESANLLDEIYHQIQNLIVKCFNLNHAVISYHSNETRMEITLKRDLISSDVLEKFWFNLSVIMTQMDPRRLLSLKVHNVGRAEIFAKEKFIPKCSQVMDQIVNKFGIKIVRNRTKVAILGGAANDMNFIKWAHDNGAMVNSAFFVNNANVRHIHDSKVLQYTNPRALMAAMADHILKKVTTTL